MWVIRSWRAISPVASTSPFFVVTALEDDALVQEAPAIVGRQSPSALAAMAKREDVQAEGR